MIKKVFNKSGIAIDFGATKISSSEIVRGKFKKNIDQQTSIKKMGDQYIQQIERNISLENELDSLTHDEDALEGYARQELGLIKDGEIIIEIEND